MEDFAQRYLAELLIHRNSGVVERWRLEDYAAGASDAGQGEYPEEEAVQDHGNEFPVFHNLKRIKKGISSLPLILVNILVLISILLCITL